MAAEQRKMIVYVSEALVTNDKSLDRTSTDSTGSPLGRRSLSFNYAILEIILKYLRLMEIKSFKAARFIILNIYFCFVKV
jgi:hypothetical protein